MNYVQYVVLNDGLRERVTREDCDASEQAGIIDRTLLPVLATVVPLDRFAEGLDRLETRRVFGKIVVTL